jgi:hypothetical protein
VGEVASSNPSVVSTSPASADQQEWITGKGEKFENRLLGPTILFQTVLLIIMLKGFLYVSVTLTASTEQFGNSILRQFGLFDRILRIIQ